MNVSDPWRYRCTECGSVAVRKRLELRQAREVIADKRCQTENTTDKRFFCDACGTALKSVHDAKLGGEVVGV